MDMATEAQRQLRGRLEDYWRAYDESDVRELPAFPLVVWVGVDEERAIELIWLIEQMRPEAQELFTVATREKLRLLLVDN
jgi:hypothetical protein